MSTKEEESETEEIQIDEADKTETLQESAQPERKTSD